MRTGAATLLPGLLDPGVAARCLDALEPRYADASTRADPGYSARSSSMRLGSVEGLEAAALLCRVFDGPLAALCRRVLGAEVACLVDECWARRQYPLQARPAEHAAHGWHQDGALGFDFHACNGRAVPPNALLPMLTCWIALTPCGDDAPGLELAGPARDDLWPPDALNDRGISAAHADEDRHRPVLAAGDALVFGGGVLHRTHVTETMTRTRTSIELRFVAPARLGDRLRGRRLLTLN